MTAATPALVLAGISRRFGSLHALRDSSLTVRAGTVHALLGENGAGKTTLMRIAYGMTQPDAGTITVHGVTRTLASPAESIAAGIGMVHQHFTLVPAMTVSENIALGRRGAYSARDAAREVVRVSQATGFALDPAALVEDLPVGAQQRVEIAKALARRARLLVLDEPTGVLAPAEVEDLLRWLRAFVREGNSAVLITHKLREALAVADDVTVLRHGRDVWHGPVTETNEDALTSAMIGGRLAHSTATSRPAPVEERRVVFRARAVQVCDDAGRVRVRDASFTIGAGELVGVAAVERSGQRELLRALARRLPVSAGTLDRPRAVGFVPEDRHHEAVLMDRSLTENVALLGLGAARGTLAWREIRERTRRLMSAFDVRAPDAGVPMRSLSGGNQQKLVLARELGLLPGDADEWEGEPVSDAETRLAARRVALDAPDAPAQESGEGSAVEPNRIGARGAPPKRLIATEVAESRHRSTAHLDRSTPSAIVVENPTRGLDVRASAAVHDRLRDAARRGAAVVVYSSDLDEVLALATRVLVMFNGVVSEPVMSRDAIGRAMVGLP